MVCQLLHCSAADVVVGCPDRIVALLLLSVDILQKNYLGLFGLRTFFFFFFTVFTVFFIKS